MSFKDVTGRHYLTQHACHMANLKIIEAIEAGTDPFPPSQAEQKAKDTAALAQKWGSTLKGIAEPVKSVESSFKALGEAFKTTPNTEEMQATLRKWKEDNKRLIDLNQELIAKNREVHARNEELAGELTAALELLEWVSGKYPGWLTLRERELAHQPGGDNLLDDPAFSAVLDDL